MCGKDFLISIPNLLLMGSPPHVRERRKRRFVGEPATRITPACAGKTFVRTSPGNSIEDHPRMCGKDGLGKGGMSQAVGSPPHVRERPWPWVLSKPE